jgi:hypothetical protein
MKQVLKYVLHEVREQEIQLPAGAHILHVDMQEDTRGVRRLTLWAFVDASQPEEKRLIWILGTGHATPEGKHFYKHISTVFDRHLVWHIFEVQRRGFKRHVDDGKTGE